MSSQKRKNQTSLWLAIGVGFLIILLLVWLTYADFFGDTDVAAFIAPLSSPGALLSNLATGVL